MAARVSFGSVHYYFGGGNGSLSEAATLYVGQIGQRFTALYLEDAAVKGRHSPMEAYVRGTFEWAETHPSHSSYWVYIHYLTSIHSKIREANYSILERARQRIEGLLYESIGKKMTPPVRDIPGISAEIRNLIVGGVTLGVCDPSKGALKTHRDLTWRSVATLLKERSET